MRSRIRPEISRITCGKQVALADPIRRYGSWRWPQNRHSSRVLTKEHFVTSRMHWNCSRYCLTHKSERAANSTYR